MKLTFEWDEAKANLNFNKHKVSFEEGKSIFYDPLLLTFPDLEHSEFEERYIYDVVEKLLLLEIFKT